MCLFIQEKEARRRDVLSIRGVALDLMRQQS